jgi:hypothetical protein
MKLNVFWSDKYDCWSIAEDGFEDIHDPISDSLTRTASDEQILDLVGKIFRIDGDDVLKIIR